MHNSDILILACFFYIFDILLKKVLLIYLSSLVPFQNNLFDNRFLPNNNPLIGMIRHAPKINDNYLNNLYKKSKSNEDLQNLDQENNKKNTEKKNQKKIYQHKQIIIM